MKIVDVFGSLKYVGQAEGDKKAYYVFEGTNNYLVVARKSTNSYNVNAVDKDAVELLTRKFKGKKVTTNDVRLKSGRPDLFEAGFTALNALYAMSALGRARKLKQRDGRAMVFKVR